MVKLNDNYQPLNELKTRYLLTNERIKELREENNRLSNQLIQLFVSYGVPQQTDEESTHPSLDVENNIRNTEQNLNDLWHYLRKHLNSDESQYIFKRLNISFNDLQVIKKEIMN